MSLKTLTSRHTVTIYTPTTTRGGAMGAIAARGTGVAKKCRVQALSVAERAALQKEGVDVSHVLYFSAQPTIGEKCEIDFVDTAGVTHVLHVVGGTNTDYLDRLWKVMAIELTDVDR